MVPLFKDLINDGGALHPVAILQGAIDSCEQNWCLNQEKAPIDKLISSFICAIDWRMMEKCINLPDALTLRKLTLDKLMYCR